MNYEHSERLEFYKNLAHGKDHNDTMISLWSKTNPNLLDFWFDERGRYRKARTRVLYGGRGSSKSHEFATVLMAYATTHKIKILCARAFQNKIEESVYGLLQDKANSLGVKDYINTKNGKIKTLNGSTFLFYGVSRNTAEIKSTEGIDICWIEEAEFLTKKQYGIIAHTLRREGSELWISFNPSDEFAFMYQNFVTNKKSMSVVRKINYMDNPYISQTFINEALALKKEDYAEYRHSHLGYPTGKTADTFFSSELLEFKEAYKPMQGYITMAVDMADDGEDAYSISIFNAYHLIELEELRGTSTKLYKALEKKLKRYNKRPVRVIYDAIGVGAGVGAYASKVRGDLDIVAFKNSYKVKNPKGIPTQHGNTLLDTTNKSHFLNYKAQTWHEVAERLLQDTLTYSPTIDPLLLIRLKGELTKPKRIKTKGMIRVEKKSELKKRGIPSTNLADGFIMGISNLWEGEAVKNVNSFFSGA